MQQDNKAQRGTPETGARGEPSSGSSNGKTRQPHSKQETNKTLGIDENETDLSRVSVFGYTEAPFFEKMHRGRSKLFRPLLVLLKLLGITPNMISGFSFLIVLFGFPLFLYLKHPFWAFFCLYTHIVLDGIDGPLAKYTESESPAGAYVDLMNDLSGMVVVLISAAHFHLMNPTMAVLYAVGYLYLSFTAMAMNVLRIPFTMVVKSKYPMYLMLTFYAATHIDLATYFAMIMTPYMYIHSAFGLHRIYRLIKSKHR